MDPKRAAGEKAVEYVSEGMVIGLGTGSTAYFMIKKIWRIGFTRTQYHGCCHF